MKIFIVVLSLTIFALQTQSQYTKVFPLASTPNISDIESFRTDELARHNYYRNLHINTSNLTLNMTLNDIAQAYAQVLYANRSFSHSQNGYGQNLYKTWGWPQVTMSGFNASDKWYLTEEPNYDYSTGTSKGGQIGHFTAMVWSDVTDVGFGYACGEQDTWETCIVVANYFPAPNVVGSYLKQVNKRK